MLRRRVAARRAVTSPAPTGPTTTCVGVAADARRRRVPRPARGGRGRPLSECDGGLVGERVIEVGNIFQLGTQVLQAAWARPTWTSRAPSTISSWAATASASARIAAAAVEQHHDEHGICLAGGDRAVPGAPARWCAPRRRPGGAGRRALRHARRGGFEVLLDDRELSPGVKFKDADLLGCPVQVVVGKRAAERVVELKPRAGGERRDLAAAACRRPWPRRSPLRSSSVGGRETRFAGPIPGSRPCLPLPDRATKGLQCAQVHVAFGR